MKTHCMVDLETLGTLPGSVIVSIGAVAFQQSEKIGLFYTNVSIKSCLNAGMVVDAGAIKFWMTVATQETRDDLFREPRGLKEALHEFNDFWRRNECNWIWSHGAGFDVPLLDVAYDLAGYGDFRPWAFRNARDTRTIYSLLPFGKPTMPLQSRKHNALADAEYQAESVRAAYRELGKELEA